MKSWLFKNNRETYSNFFFSGFKWNCNLSTLVYTPILMIPQIIINAGTDYSPEHKIEICYNMPGFEPVPLDFRSPN